MPLQSPTAATSANGAENTGLGLATVATGFETGSSPNTILCDKGSGDNASERAAAAAASQRTTVSYQMLRRDDVGAALAKSAFTRRLKGISGGDVGVERPNDTLVMAERRMHAVPEPKKLGEDAGGAGGEWAMVSDDLKPSVAEPDDMATISTGSPPDATYVADGSPATSRKGDISLPRYGSGKYTSKGPRTNPTWNLDACSSSSSSSVSPSLFSSSDKCMQVAHVEQFSGKWNIAGGSSKAGVGKDYSKPSLVEAALPRSPEPPQSSVRSAMVSSPSDKEDGSAKRVAAKKSGESNYGHGDRRDGRAGATGPAGIAGCRSTDESSGQSSRSLDSFQDSPRYGNRRESSFSAPSAVDGKGKGARESGDWIKGDGYRGISRDGRYGRNTSDKAETGAVSREHRGNLRSVRRSDLKSDRSRSRDSLPPSRKDNGFVLRSTGLVDRSLRGSREDGGKGSRRLPSNSKGGGGGSSSGAGGGGNDGGGRGRGQKHRQIDEYSDTRHGGERRGHWAQGRRGGAPSSSPERKERDLRHVSRRRGKERRCNRDASSIPRKRDAHGLDCRVQGVQPARGIRKHEDRHLGNRRSRDRGGSNDCRSQDRKSHDRRRSRERESRSCRSPDRKLQGSRSVGHGSADLDTCRGRGHGHASRVPLDKRDPKILAREGLSPSLPAAVAASLSPPVPSTKTVSQIASGISLKVTTPPPGASANAGHLSSATATGGSPITAGKNEQIPAKLPRKGLEFGQGMATGFKKPKPITAEEASKLAAFQLGEDGCELPEPFVDMVGLPRPGDARPSGTDRSQSTVSNAKRKPLQAAADEALRKKRNICDGSIGNAMRAGIFHAGATAKEKGILLAAGGRKKTHTAARSGRKRIGKSRPRSKVKLYRDIKNDATTLSTGKGAAGKGVVPNNRDASSLPRGSDTPAKVGVAAEEREVRVNVTKVEAATTSGDGNGQVPPEATEIDAMAEAAVAAITERLLISYMKGAAFAVAAGGARPTVSQPLAELGGSRGATQPSAADAAKVGLAAPTASTSPAQVAVTVEGVEVRLAVGGSTVTAISQDSTPSPRSPADIMPPRQNRNKACGSVGTGISVIGGRVDLRDNERTSDSHDRERRKSHTPSGGGLHRRDTREYNGRDESRASAGGMKPRSPCETQQHGDRNRRSIDRASGERSRSRARARGPARSRSPPSRHRSRTTNRGRCDFFSRSRSREDHHRRRRRHRVSLSRSRDRGEQKRQVGENRGQGGHNSYRQQDRDERPHGRRYEEGRRVFRGKGSGSGGGGGGGSGDGSVGGGGGGGGGGGRGGGRGGQIGSDGEGLGDGRCQEQGRSHTLSVSADKRVQERTK